MEAAFVDLLDKCSLAAGALGLSGKGFVSAALILGPIEADVRMSRLSGRFRKPSSGWRSQLETVGQRLGDHLQPIFDALWMGAGIAEGSMSFRHGGWAGYRGERAYGCEIGWLEVAVAFSCDGRNSCAPTHVCASRLFGRRSPRSLRRRHSKASGASLLSRKPGALVGWNR